MTAGRPTAGTFAAGQSRAGTTGIGASRVPRPAKVLAELRVNGERYELALDPRTTLLDALRIELGLTGTKLGCDHGDCGACSVLVDGRAEYACLRLAVDCDDRHVVTVEGLAPPGELTPVQQAFVTCDALQCGFCTPGQVISATSLLDQTAHPDDAEIERGMSGNLCRCGAYVNVREAVRRAADGSSA